MSRRRSPSGSLKAGDVIGGKYRVQRLLGEGGMGMVVAAQHTLLDQSVAVKLLYSDDDEAVSRLIIEAKSAAKIPGDHVARVLDIDRGEDGLPFIVMELLDGVDLYQVLSSQGPLPRWLVVDYMLQALMGLSGAHVRGIVHRDLKPANLFLARMPDGSQVIKVLDFGVSKSTFDAATDQRLTGARAMLGSPPYMSPEQVRSPKTVDVRADIWAMGIVMFELLTGRLPFRGVEVQETFAQILEHDAPRVRDLAPEVPEDMDRAISKCLAKDREDRFQDVAALAKALVPFGSGAWTHAASEIKKTLERPVPEDTRPSLRGLTPSTGREIDVQPTASTVIGKRKFALSNETSRSPIIIAGAVMLAAFLFVAAFFIRHAKVSESDPDQITALATAVQTATPPIRVPQATQAPVQTGQALFVGQAPASQTNVGSALSPLDFDDAGIHARPQTVIQQAVPPSQNVTAPPPYYARKSRPNAVPQSTHAATQSASPPTNTGSLPSELLGQH